jgi:hypothetical protein
LKAEKKEKLANSVETMGGAKCATVRIGVDDNMRRESCSSVRLQIIKLISLCCEIGNTLTDFGGKRLSGEKKSRFLRGAIVFKILYVGFFHLSELSEKVPER